MYKKYAFATTDAPYLFAFMTILLPLAVIGIVLMPSGYPALGIFCIYSGLILGIIFGIVNCVYVNKHIIKNEHFRSLDQYARGTLRLMKVVNEQVVGFDRKFWKSDTVYPVVIPWCSGGFFTTSVWLTKLVRDIEVSVKIELTAYVTDGDESHTHFRAGFVPQEVYEVVTKNGYDMITTWLSAAFKKAADNTASIQQAFEQSHKTDPFSFAEAIAQALPNVRYRKLLSNITRVEAVATIDSASFRARTTY